MKQTYTVIIKEDTSPFPPVYPEILIYTVEVEPPLATMSMFETDSQFHKDLKKAVARHRFDDFGEPADTKERRKRVIEQIAKGLSIKLIFDGEINAMGDCRR